MGLQKVSHGAPQICNKFFHLPIIRRMWWGSGYAILGSAIETYADHYKAVQICG